MPALHKAIQAALDAHLNGFSFAGLSDDDDGELYEVVGSTAIVPVEGIILNKCSGLESLCGAFSLDTFKGTLREVAARADVANIILSISSGGGITAGFLFPAI